MNVTATLSPDDLARACADAMWKDDDASRGLGMEILDIRSGKATMAMTVKPHMVNGQGIAHGGFIFTLADSAFAFACNSHNERVVAAQEVPSPSRETEFVRLGVMRLLRELPEYEAAFEYPVRGKTIDCFLKPHASDHPVIFVEAKITLRSLRRAREAVAQLRRAAAGWGRKAVTVLLAGSVEEAVQYNWPQMFSGSHLLRYDIERNDFVGEGVQEIVSAVRVAEEG